MRCWAVIAAVHGLLGLVSEQSLYNLLTRDIELEVRPAAGAYGVGSSRGARCKAVCSAALKKEREGRRQAGRARRPCGPTGTRSTPSRTYATRSAKVPPSSRWPGCCTRRESPRRSSPAHHRAARRAAACRQAGPQARHAGTARRDPPRLPAGPGALCLGAATAGRRWPRRSQGDQCSWRPPASIESFRPASRLIAASRR